MHSTAIASPIGAAFGAPMVIDVYPPAAGAQHTAGPTVVSVSGEVDASNSHEIDASVEALFTRRQDVVIDLTGVTFIDSCGLWAAVGLPQIARSYGVGSAVVTNDVVDRLIGLVNHCRPPWIFDDRSAAVDALTTSGLWLAL